MKKLLTLVVLLVAAAAFAGTYSITTTAAQDNRLEKQRVRLNEASCLAAELPKTCTQAQCRNVNPGCDIYSNIGELIDRNIVKNYVDSLKTTDTRDDQTKFCDFWNAPSTTIAQRNAVCAASALPNGCELCL
jgi:hypothetical protein